MGSQRMRMIELIGQDFRHRDRRSLSDPFHRCNLFANSPSLINRRVPQQTQKKRRTSDSMMRVGICESATRAMRCFPSCMATENVYKKNNQCERADPQTQPRDKLALLSGSTRKSNLSNNEQNQNHRLLTSPDDIDRFDRSS